MLEINGVYNFIKIEIRDYIKKEIRKIKKLDEDDCWCRLYIYLKNEYLEIDDPYYDLECCEVDNLYEMLKLYINNEMDDNTSFEPIEPSFKIYFYPFGKEFKNKNYEKKGLSIEDKTANIFVAFVEKDTTAPSDDGVILELSEEEVRELFYYIKSIMEK